MNAGAHRDEAGGALVLALLAMTVLGTFTTLALQNTTRMVHGTEAHEQDLALLYAAEGGVQHARHALARDPGFGGAEVEVGRAVVTTTVTTGQGGRATVVAIARAGTAPTLRSHRVQVGLALTGGLPRLLSWRED